MSSISDFRAKVVSQGFAKTARYRVQINGSGQIPSFAGANLDRLQFLCETAEVPGKTLNASDVHYYGPGFKSPNQSIYNMSSFMFMVVQNMDEKRFFDAWLDYINGRTSGYDMNFREDYATTIDVFTLKETEGIDDTGTMKFTLNDAFPISVNPMAVNSADDAFHKIQVDFTYTDYSVVVP